MTDINYFLQHPNHLIKFTYYRKHNPDNIITGIAVVAKQSRFWEHNEKYKSMIYLYFPYDYNNHQCINKTMVIDFNTDVIELHDVTHDDLNLWLQNYKTNNKDTDDFQIEHGIYINDIKLCVI